MLLSIVILNFKSKNLTRECIKGILHLNLQFEFEIIVVDNGSSDGVGEMLKQKFGEQENIRFIQLSKNIGMGAGNNTGLKAARGKYVLILNPDTVVFEHSLKPLVDFLESHPQVGVVAPKLLNPDKSYQQTIHKFPKFWMPFYRRTFLGRTKKGQAYLAEYIVDGLEINEPCKVDWVFGPAFMIRKEIAERLGGFDERFFLFFEDTDLCRRVWQAPYNSDKSESTGQAGYEVWYVPQAQIVHYPDRASGHDLGLWSLGKKATWHHIASWLKYFWKWRRG